MLRLLCRCIRPKLRRRFPSGGAIFVQIFTIDQTTTEFERTAAAAATATARASKRFGVASVNTLAACRFARGKLVLREQLEPKFMRAFDLHSFFRGTLASCCLGVTSCVPQLIIEEGDVLIYEHSQSRTPCGGTVRSLDQFALFLADQLGIRISGSFRYSWLNRADEELVPGFCTGDCVLGRHAMAFFPALKHEVVHLVMSEVAYFGGPFFAEGIAGAYDPYSDGYGGPYPDPSRIGDPRDTLAASGSVEVEYSTAAGFVAFLLTRHGPAKFRALYFRLRGTPDMAEIRRAFSEVYHLDLDREADLYMAGTACEPGHFVVRAYECEAPVGAWGAQSWTHRGSLDCSDEDVAGGIGEFQWRSHRAVTVDIPAAGSYRIGLEGDEGVEILVGRCFGCVWDRRDVFLAVGDEQIASFEAGRHFVRIGGDSERTPVYEVVITPDD